MKKVVMYTGNPCPYCVYAKALLNSKNIPFEEINVWEDDNKRGEMLKTVRVRNLGRIFCFANCRSHRVAHSAFIMHRNGAELCCSVVDVLSLPLAVLADLVRATLRPHLGPQFPCI